MSQGQFMGDSQVIADAHGIFHVFWGQPDAENDHRLLTRTVQVPISDGATTTPSVKLPSQTHNELSAGVSARTFHTHPVPHRTSQWFAIPGQRDISPSIALDFERPHYDASSHTIAVNVILINNSHRIIQGPISFVGFDMHSNFGTPRPVNARGWVHGRPYWDATSLLPADGLHPNGRSAPLHLEFRIAHFKLLPLIPLVPHEGDIVAMHVGVYQR